MGDERRGQRHLDDSGKLAVHEPAGAAAVSVPGSVGIEIKTLVVAPAPRLQLALGDVASLEAWVERNREGIEAVVWNEEEVTLVVDAGREVRYRPEMNPAIAMFFDREHKRVGGGFGGDPGVRVWEGDYEPVEFSKKNLLAYVKRHPQVFPQEVVDAVKKLKVNISLDQREEMLSEDTDDQVTVKEERALTNVPRKFSVVLPVTEDMTAEFQFEAEAVRLKDKYGHEGEKYGVKLRCANAREALRNVMTKVLDRLPADVPRYYGRMRVVQGRAE